MAPTASRKDRQLYLETLFDGAADTAVSPADISSASEHRSCADLHRMVRDGELELRPPWQRDLVWDNEIKTRLIDSLARQMPVPSVLLCHDKDTGDRQVIDGLQRIATIIQYFDDGEWVFDDLPDITTAIAGRPASSVRAGKAHRAIANATLPLTVISYRSSKPDHLEYLFTIFYRVNRGSVRLNAQEVRNAIYAGRFNDMLKRCDEGLAWRALTRRVPEADGDRFAYREVILRAFALVDRRDRFTGTLNTFLNRFMSDMRNTPEEECRMKEACFDSAVSFLLQNNLITGELLSALSDASVKLETLCYGLLRHANLLATLDREEAEAALRRWAAGDCLQPKALSNKLYGKEALRARLDWTDEVFGGVHGDRPTPLQTTFA